MGAWAWLELLCATDEQAYLTQAKELAEGMEEQFAVPEGGCPVWAGQRNAYRPSGGAV